MPRPTPLEAKLARIAELRGKTLTDADADFARKVLGERSAYLVTRAAEVAGESGNTSFVPTLVEAFAALADDPLKDDRGCLAKMAIAESLVKLHCHDANFYRKGIKYVQMEFAFGSPGGQIDTAAGVRAACAMGLVECENTFDAMILFAELLADRWRPARSGAARAIAALQSQQGIPLLRYKLLIGDAEPEVIGECCTALLELNAPLGVPMVAEMLSANAPQVCLEAACSLGESRRAEAFEPLRACWQKRRDSDISGGLLSSIALLRRKEGTQFLVSLIADADQTAAEDAIRALAPYRFASELADQVETAVAACKSKKIRRLFENKFGENRE